MLARSIGLFLAAVSVTAWPIFFYENALCDHYPVFTLESPPEPNTCNSFGHVDIKAYSGGTRDGVEKLLIYYDVPTGPVCEIDAAHRAYANHTIHNSTNLCVSTPDIPRSYVFIEEILGPIPVPSPISAPKTPKTPANASACDSVLRVQK